MTFSSGMELAYGTTWILYPNEGTQYGSFVLPKWRGQGIFSLLNVALNIYAREHGVLRSVGSISVLNSQSLSMAKRLGKKKLMTVILVHVRGIGWTFRKAIGAPLHTRFAGHGMDLGARRHHLASATRCNRPDRNFGRTCAPRFDDVQPHKAPARAEATRVKTVLRHTLSLVTLCVSGV
jgi:GNAT superfamily N-acetyltransferase